MEKIKFKKDYKMKNKSQDNAIKIITCPFCKKKSNLKDLEIDLRF